MQNACQLAVGLDVRNQKIARLCQPLLGPEPEHLKAKWRPRSCPIPVIHRTPVCQCGGRITHALLALGLVARTVAHPFRSCDTYGGLATVWFSLVGAFHAVPSIGLGAVECQIRKF
jgi:hypothetical protein